MDIYLKNRATIRQAISNIRCRQIRDSQDRLLSRFISDKVFAENRFGHPSNACLSKWLIPSKSKKILELGCGPGKYAAMLATLGYQVIGIDPICFPTWGIIKSRTSAILLDKVFAENLPFRDKSFDHVVCLGAILYFDDVPKALKEIGRVVKPGGKVIIRTVNKNNLYTLRTGRKLDPASKNLYTMDELVGLIENSGLSVVEKFSYGYWPPVGTDFWWYFQCIWLPLPIQDALSASLPSQNRVNNIVIAERDV